MKKPFFSESDCDSWAKDGHPRISITKANCLIQERAKVVYGRVDGNFGWLDICMESSTHQALLICGEEIEKDSEIKILKDLINVTHPIADVINRAKRLLGK